MFATILLCSSDDSGVAGSEMGSGGGSGSRRYGSAATKGMSMFRHIHSKITQDVCNAIFLCKVQSHCSERARQEKSKKCTGLSDCPLHVQAACSYMLRTLACSQSVVGMHC